MYFLTAVLSLSSGFNGCLPAFLTASLAFTKEANLALNDNFKFDIVATTGACPRIFPPYLFSSDKTLFEGANYVKYTDPVSHSSCFVTNIVVDESGSFHASATALVNGELTRLDSMFTPIPGMSGIFKSSASRDENNITVTVNCFFVDTEMIVNVETICFNADNKYFHIVSVGFRNLDWVREKEPQLKRILKKLEYYLERKVTLNSIPHDETCKYPRVVTNHEDKV